MNELNDKGIAFNVVFIMAVVVPKLVVCGGDLKLISKAGRVLVQSKTFRKGYIFRGRN